MGVRDIEDKALLNPSDARPRSAPALELHSRAESSVGVMYRSSSPNTGSNPGGGWILKKIKKRYNNFFKVGWLSIFYDSGDPNTGIVCLSKDVQSPDGVDFECHLNSRQFSVTFPFE